MKGRGPGRPGRGVAAQDSAERHFGGQVAAGDYPDVLEHDPLWNLAESAPCDDVAGCGEAADLGDLVVMLLAGTLAGLRDRLVDDGYERAADLLGDLVDVANDYLSRIAA